MGLIIGCCVSWSLLRFFERIPTKDPILKSVILSSIALVIAILLIDVPQSFVLFKSDGAVYYFLIGVLFNAARFLFLGLVIGYLYKRLYESA
jgi:NhaP-type Na+/H+ or K+/H+ antiporter